MKPWIGVDLDGTLAEYNGWVSPEHIGPIIEPMKKRVLDWLEEGSCEVKIFTARVAGDREGMPPVTSKIIIQQWLVNNGLPRLQVTNVKDFHMVELYDDRAVQVVFNTGELYGESTMKYRHLLKKQE